MGPVRVVRELMVAGYAIVVTLWLFLRSMTGVELSAMSSAVTYRASCHAGQASE